MRGHTYLGWEVSPAYVGWVATHPNFDASYEGPEDGWVGNGLQVNGNTLDEVHAEIRLMIEEDPEHCSVPFTNADMLTTLGKSIPTTPERTL